MPSQSFHITHEMKRKCCKTHPHHRAIMERKKWFRRQLTIDPTADADHQQGANGGNLKDNIGARDKAMEPNILHAQDEW
ncbi:MAG: hypothetical protein EZS28_001419 [Streblomastix strix]|uniref:Uncharacterized protein n=1 Tax=Streblomastix strix TaxID=222440 RepID=A0A5J4X724_9EUKA|nr:MAG: hypothetical protein EZS28_001419 [Streblomastix strix]